MSRLSRCVLAIAVSMLAGTPARTQDAPADVSTPAHVSAVDGRAMLERDGKVDAAAENQPLLEGDRLRTEAGRLEMLLPDASVLALDRDTTVDLQAGGVVRVSAGRVVFVVAGQAGVTPRSYSIEAAAGTVITGGAGEYRISTFEESGRQGVEVAVVAGEATLVAARGSSLVQAGRRAVAREGLGVEPSQAFDPTQADAFYDWADGLRAARAGSRSNAYLPADLQTYSGAFDRNGTWEQSPDNGWVWYPTVAADWRPYYDGAWEPYSWGWTWVGAGPWVWPTHHYGRWGYGGRGWYWIPSAAWGPGWVSWGIASDYVSWCPLGYNDYPVFSLSFGLGFGFGGGYGYGYGHGYNPWHGWTVVPHGTFGGHYYVPSHAIRGDGLRAVERASFAVNRWGPAVPGRAVPRYGNVGGAQPYNRTGMGAEAGRSNGARVAPGTAAPRSYSTAPSYAGARNSGAPSTGAPRGFGAQSSSAVPRSYSTAPSSSAPRSFAAPRSYGAPTSPSGARSYSTAPSSSAPRSFAAPRSYGNAPSMGSPRSYSNAPSYSAPRSYAAPRSYGSAPSMGAPRSYSTAPSYSAPRSNAAPRSYSASPPAGGRAPASSGGGRPSGGEPRGGARKR